MAEPLELRTTGEDIFEHLAGVTPLPSLQQPISRGDRVREAIQRAILDGTLEQGRPLIEREIAGMLGVSKTPVREALKQLHSSGLVEINVYQGVSVRRLDVTTVRELYEARAIVESHAVRLSVQRVGAAINKGARQALKDAESLLTSDQPALLGLANRRFHVELYRECENTLLLSFLDKLRVLAAFVATAGWRIQATFGDEAQEHAMILRAVEEGDAERAEQLTRTHIIRASKSLLWSLDETGEASRNRSKVPST